MKYSSVVLAALLGTSSALGSQSFRHHRLPISKAEAQVYEDALPVELGGGAPPVAKQVEAEPAVEKVRTGFWSSKDKVK